MDTAIDFTPFLIGVMLGITLAVLLDIWIIAVMIAGAALISVLAIYFQGGHEALIMQATRIARLAQDGQTDGYISGILVGKMASGIRRGLLPKKRARR